MSSPSQFRSDFPEFADANTYSDGSISFWMNFATVLIDATRWAELADMGIELATAHHLVIASRDEKAGSTGASPGQVSGPITSKSVDRVSVSNDTSAVSLSDGGFWNMTSYGIRFLQLARMLGSGPIQL